MDEQQYYDLYLYSMTVSEEFICIPHLTKEEGIRLGSIWFDRNHIFDYLVTLEGNKPFLDEQQNVIIQTPEWLESL